MGGSTSPGGLKEHATRLTPLFEHDDDDDDDDIGGNSVNSLHPGNNTIRR